MLNFSQQLQTQLYQKRKAFSGFFIAFVKCTSRLEDFQKKDEASGLSIHEMIEWLLKCLKGPTSEHVSVNNLLVGSKHCSDEYGTTITECFDESGIN